MQWTITVWLRPGGALAVPCVFQTAWGWRSVSELKGHLSVAGGHCAGLRQPGCSSRLLQGPANLPVTAHVSSGWNWATTADWLGWGGFLNHWNDADTSRTRKKRRLFSLLPSPVIGVRCCQFTLLSIHCAGIFGFVLSVIFKQTTKYLLYKIQKLVWGWWTCCWDLRFPFMAIPLLSLPATFRRKTLKNNAILD